MTKLIVFDVDGTILDSYGLYGRAVEFYSREQGLPMPCLETIQRGYGDPHNHDFKWGVGRNEQVEHLYATFRIVDAWTVSGEAEKTPQLFDGVRDMLEHLKDTQHTLAIVTSKPEPPLLHLLDYHGIGKFFCAHRNGTDVKRRGEREKPHPDMLQSVMRDLKFAPDETVMIGDTTMDIHMGRAAGAHTIGVTWGAHPRDHLTGADAHHIVDAHIHGIAATIKKIFS